MAFQVPAFAPPAPASVRAEIVAVENAFCAMTRQRGLLAAFEHFAAPDVAFLDLDPRQCQGLAAVRRKFAGVPPDVQLTWTPLFTSVSEDGTLAYDYGRYESRRKGAGGKPVIAGGFYLTIWKRQPDGRWRFVMDTGSPDRPPPG